MDLVAYVCASRRKLLADLGAARLGPRIGAGAWAVVYGAAGAPSVVVKFQRVRGIRTDDPLVPFVARGPRDGDDEDEDESAAQAALCPTAFSVASAVARTWHELAALQCLAPARFVPRLATRSIPLAQAALAVPMEHLGAPVYGQVLSRDAVGHIADALHAALVHLDRVNVVHGDIHAGQVYWVPAERRVVLGDWGPPDGARTRGDDRSAVAHLVQDLVRVASAAAVTIETASSPACISDLMTRVSEATASVSTV